MRHHQSAFTMKRAAPNNDAPATSQRADNNRSAPPVGYRSALVGLMAADGHGHAVGPRTDARTASDYERATLVGDVQGLVGLPSGRGRYTPVHAVYTCSAAGWRAGRRISSMIPAAATRQMAIIRNDAELDPVAPSSQPTR